MVKAGAFQYITKPFKTGELLNTVEQALARSAPQRAQARLHREMPAAPTPETTLPINNTANEGANAVIRPPMAVMSDVRRE